jgi:hypothetical protein
MTYTGEGARGGNWCGAPPLVWVELAPLAFWLDSTIVMEVLLAGCRTLTFGISLKVGCTEPLAMVERT